MKNDISRQEENPILVRLVSPTHDINAKLASAIAQFPQLGSMVVDLSSTGGSTTASIEVTTPCSEISAFILQLGRMGQVAVITRVEREEIVNGADRVRSLSPTSREAAVNLPS